MKKALLFGVNNTIGAPLQGCINDVNDMKATLQGKGFTSITTRTNSQCTNYLMRSAINSFITGIRSTDQAVIYFSQHGSQKPDTSGDESDGLDELICPQDFSSTKYIDDDWLRGQLARIPSGAIVDVIADTCHSGTVTRAGCIDGLMPRFLAFPPGPRKIGKGKREYVPTAMNHILSGACRADQTSWEGIVYINGVPTPRGLFTNFYCKAVRENVGSRADIMASVEASLAALGLNQTPQLECKPEMAALPPFQ